MARRRVGDSCRHRAATFGNIRSYGNFATRAVQLDVGWEFRRWEDGRVLSAEDLSAACERLYGEHT